MVQFIHRIKMLKGDSRGVTLVEVMVSLLVFVIGIMGMAAMQTTSVNNNDLAERVQINTVLGMSQIETLMASDYDDQRIANDVEGSTVFIDAYTGLPYTLSWDPKTESAIPGAKKVEVTATFAKSASHKEQTVTFNIIKPFIDVVP